MVGVDITNIIKNKLIRHLGDGIRDIIEFRGETTFVIDKKVIKQACMYAKQRLGFSYCVDICGADMFSEKNRFEVIYNILNIPENQRIRYKVSLDETDLVLDSVVSVWESANWFERETYDMYGVMFNGHPDLRRIYMPEDFEYYPLRKEFPLIGIPGSIPMPKEDNRVKDSRHRERYNKGEQI